MKHIENNKILNGVLSLLDEEEKAILYSKIKIENYRAKELIVRAGEKKNYSIYILKGLVRCFKIKDNGDEVTLFVRVENQFLTVLDTVFFKEASTLNYEAFEPTSLIIIDFDALENFISQNPRLIPIRHKFITNNLKESLELNQRFILLSPEERYLKFRNENLNLLKRIPDKFIANILGITPVSLSRIKKRLSKKGRT